MLESKLRCKVSEVLLGSEARLGGGSVGKANVACGTHAKPCEIPATSLQLTRGRAFETTSVKTRIGRRGVGCNGKYYCIEFYAALVQYMLNPNTKQPRGRLS